MVVFYNRIVFEFEYGMSYCISLGRYMYLFTGVVMKQADA